VAGWLARHCATIRAVRVRETELLPKMLESMCKSFMLWLSRVVADGVIVNMKSMFDKLAFLH
jgi:hypothetical protein